MNKENAVKKHPFFDRHTVMAVILLVFANVFFYMMLAGFGALFAGTDYCSYIGAIGGPFILLFFSLFFKNEFAGFFKENRTSVGIRIAAVMLIYYIYLLIQTAVWGKFGASIPVILGTSIMAGVCEESVYRGVVISYLFRQWKEEKRIIAILLISSIVFGLSHGMNYLNGAPLGITVTQMIGCVGLGALLSAIYIRSGNLFVAMIAHGATDFVAMLDLTQTGGNGIMKAAVGLPQFIDLGICAVLFIIALYLVRPAKWPEIKELWDKKWNR